MDGNNRIKEMIRFVKATDQYKMNETAIKMWEKMGETARIIGINLPMKRVKCPSCGMNASRFISCENCGGPACDNCQNMAKGFPICSVCR